ncbi:hypothetical protein KOR34_16420 [Posidoniimonas corsicana]|uniref:PsbP C-terminal domain-containing protein n=2 Tax=Posidoniimonas corsicana TaxID=1938618 RepID=A0A5C5VGD9_9BACT|nr:hypothetical protein KOR34_16420 [Posidoniimonas corsicana]
MMLKHLLLAALLILPGLSHAQTDTAAPKPKDAAAAKPKPPVMVPLADGDLVMPAPADWKQVKPRNRIIEQEFAVAIKEVDAPARFTVMASGGSIEQNVNRWIGQFKKLAQPEEGKPGELHDLEVNGMKAHWVDLAGDYLDSPRGPFGPKVEKKDYRVLAAIVETKDSGNYFFKLVGPDKVVAKHKDAFLTMLKGVKAK